MKTWQKNILGGRIRSACWCFWRQQQSQFFGQMGVESVTAMIGFYYVFQTEAGYVLEIVKQLPICKNLVQRISFFMRLRKKTDGVKTVGEVTSMIFGT